jgi:hypothetical protein
MGLGFDEDNDRVVLIMQELMVGQDQTEGDEDDEEEDEADDLAGMGLSNVEDEDAERPSVVRLWCSREQMRALSIQASDIVKQGRADPRLNGRLVYYWT